MKTLSCLKSFRSAIPSFSQYSCEFFSFPFLRFQESLASDTLLASSLSHPDPAAADILTPWKNYQNQHTPITLLATRIRRFWPKISSTSLFLDRMTAKYTCTGTTHASRRALIGRPNGVRSAGEFRKQQCVTVQEIFITEA